MTWPFHVFVSIAFIFQLFLNLCEAKIGHNDNDSSIFDMNKSIFLNHIPKTGGTTLEKLDVNKDFKDKCHIIFNTLEYFKFDKCKTRSGAETLTNFHCWHSQNSHFNAWISHHQQLTTFCFIRDPVQRFLSTYNMRSAGHFKYYKSGDKCDTAHMLKYLEEKYLAGELDNHDVAQVNYHCNIKLCFEKYDSSVSTLLSMRNCSISWAQEKLLVKKHSWQPLRICSLSDIPDTVFHLIRKNYAEDYKLHQDVCAKNREETNIFKEEVKRDSSPQR